MEQDRVQQSRGEAQPADQSRFESRDVPYLPNRRAASMGPQPALLRTSQERRHESLHHLQVE